MFRMTLTLLLLLMLKTAVGIIILAIGMDSTLRDATHLLQRPALLVRSLLAMYVLVPLVAFALVKVLTLSPGVEVGLLVLAVSAGAPLLPRKLLKIGDGAYIFSLVVISSLLAVVVIPAWLAVLRPQFRNPPDLDPLQAGLVLAKSFFLPLAIGMIVRGFFPTFAKRIVTPLMSVAGIVLTLSALMLLFLHWQVLLDAGWRGVLSLILLMGLALAIGHLLGGPTEDDRTALAIACASRHIGVAVLVAASRPGPRTAVIIAVYILASALVSLPYLRWRRAAIGPA